MAGKEATLVLLDVGSSMYEKFEGVSGDKTRRLDISIDCLKLMLQNKIFNNKTHEVGLILFGAEEAEDGKTIYIQELQKPELNFVRNVGDLGEHDIPTKVGGDIFDALDKAVAQIDEYVSTKKYSKKIFILTCGCGETEYTEKQLQKLIRLIQKVDIKINFIAIDFMDEYDPESDNIENPQKLDKLRNIMYAGSEKQTVTQNQNQKLIFQMQEELRNNMRVFPAQIAFELYSQFRTKEVSARASYRGEFQINKNFSIQVMIYKKTTEEKLPSLKKYSTVAQFNNKVGSNEVKNDSVFYIQDDPNMTPVEKENIIKGYQYGKQIVPIDSIMEEKMKYKCERNFSLLGFVEKAAVPRHFFMSSVDMVVPVDSEKSRKQMSALITALIATKKVGLARFVGRVNGAPKLMVLIPHKNDEYECFWMIALPTVEDIRNFQFSSLKRATPAQQVAVGQLIDQMDLCAFPNQQGEPEELLKMKLVVNPTRQYFQQAMMYKALTQSEQIPPISNVILEYLRPENRVYEHAQAVLNKIKQIFKFKEHEIKKAGEKKVFWKQIFDQEAQVVQDDEVMEIDANAEELTQMIAKQKFGFDKADEIVKEVGSVTPIEDFRRMISNKHVDLVETALTQIQKLIIRLVEESLGGSYHDKALECLKEMRKACVDQDETEQFNSFLNHLRRFQHSQQEMFWANIIKEGITLISTLENPKSKVSADEARLFLNQADQQAQELVDKLQNEEEELLAEIE